MFGLSLAFHSLENVLILSVSKCCKNLLELKVNALPFLTANSRVIPPVSYFRIQTLKLTYKNLCALSCVPNSHSGSIWYI